MFGTRSKNKTDGDNPPVTTTGNTATTMSSGAVSRQADKNETTIDRPAEDEADPSGESMSGHSTIVTPPYSNISARGIVDAFRQSNEPLRAPSNRDYLQQEFSEARALTHDDLRNLEDRLLNRLPQLIQQRLSISAQQSGNVGGNISFPGGNPPTTNRNCLQPGVSGTRGVTPDDLRNFENRLDSLIRQGLHTDGPQNSNGGQQQARNFSIPDVSQPPPCVTRAPVQHLQIQPWPNNLPNPNRGSSSFNENGRPEIPVPPQYQRQVHYASAGPGLRVDKWGINFDGTPKTTSIEDFVFRVEALQSDFGCDWRDVIKSFHHLLNGPAREWFWDHRRFHNISRWIDLKAALLTQFHRYESDFDIQRKILDRRQNAQESFEDFYNSVIKLRNQLRSPLGETDLVTVMRGNLKAPMAQLLFSAPVSGLAQFAKECRRAENLLNNQRQFSGRHPGRAVHAVEVETVGREDTVEVDALDSTRKLQCWNCKAEGHCFVDCTEEKRALFCYRCGLEVTVTPRCTNCQGNRKVNVSQSGTETRSKSQKPTQQKQQQ